MEAIAKQQLTAAARDITRGWTADQCTGRAAVLVMRQLIHFSEQALAPGYGLLDSTHFKLQHDSAIEKLITEELKTAGTGQVQLADMFQALQAKQAELTGLAESEFKSLKHDREQETQRAENRELLSKLVASQAQHKTTQNQPKAGPGARTRLGSVGGCRYANQGTCSLAVNVQPNSKCNRDATWVTLAHKAISQ